MHALSNREDQKVLFEENENKMIKHLYSKTSNSGPAVNSGQNFRSQM